MYRRTARIKRSAAQNRSSGKGGDKAVLFQLMGLAVVVVAPYFVFKTAKENRKSPILWGLATLVGGLCIQYILPVLVGVLLMIFFLATGTPRGKLQETLETPNEILTYAGIFLSVVFVVLILRFVGKIPDDGPVKSKPNEFSIYHDE